MGRKSVIKADTEEDNVFLDVEEDDTTLPELKQVNDDPEDNSPKIGDVGWQDYVLSLLTKDEVVVKDGVSYPKSVGLRRVAQKLLGPIIESGPTTVFPPSGPNNQSTVVYQIKILWTHNFNQAQITWLSETDLLNQQFHVRTFSEVADCSRENTHDKYAIHSTATAATRAEGRAFRKALQLSVLTADEVSAGLDFGNSESVTTEQIENSKISELQKITIDSLCKRLKINIEKFLEFNNIESLNDCTSAQASSLMSILQKYQTSSDEKLSIPDFIKEASLG